MGRPGEDIENALKRLRHAVRRQRATSGLLWAAGILGGLLALSVGVGGFGRPFVAVQLLLIGSGLGLALWLLWFYGRLGRDLQQLAGLAESLAPELGTAVSSAVFFQRASDQDPLVEEHLRRTAGSGALDQLESRLRASKRVPQKRAWLVATIGLGVGVLSVWVAPHAFRQMFEIVVSGQPTERLNSPLVGDLRLRYRFPAYTGLAERTVQGGDGTIVAIAGSVVSIEGVADRTIRAAEIWMRTQDNGERERQIFDVGTDARSITGTLTITREATYGFRLRMNNGRWVEESVGHPIRIQPDALPEIGWITPQSDVTLKASETLPIRWSASDDFGVSEVALLVLRSGQELKRIELPVGKQTQQPKGSFSWTPSDDVLEDGDDLQIYLEATDNDTMTGPKRARSTERRVSVFSARKEHQRLMDAQREIQNKLVDWLARDLVQSQPKRSGQEAPYEQKTQALARDTLGFINRTARALRDDALASDGISLALDNLQKRFRQLIARRDALLQTWLEKKKAGMPRPLLSLITETARRLEKAIIYLDDLLAEQRIQDLKATSESLLAAQREMRELLKAYQDSKDPTLKEALVQKIQELKSKMAQLMSQMAEVRQRLPGEYRNSEAGELLEMDDQLERLEKMLEDDDLDGLAEEVERLTNMVENTVNRMNDASSDVGEERYSEVQEELNEFAQSFSRLESEQNALADRSDKMLRTYRKKAIEKAGGSLPKLIKKIRAEVTHALASLDDVASYPRMFGALERETSETRQRLVDLDALLEEGDYYEARQFAERAQGSAESVLGMLRLRNRRNRLLDRDLEGVIEAGKKTRSHIEKAQELLDRLFPDPKDTMSEQDQRAMKNMGRKQEALEQELEDLEKKMDQLAEQVPLFGGQPKTKLGQAGKSMGKASDALAEDDISQAARHGRHAAERLSELRESMEQASQSNGGRGLPLPLGTKRPGGSGRGSQQLSQEDVSIPQEQKSPEGPKFREQLLEAAKQKAPEGYKEAVRRYYEELIR